MLSFEQLAFIPAHLRNIIASATFVDNAEGLAQDLAS
jgi:hypothetical protein